MPIETLLFDLDGTLVDTAPDLAATLDVVLQSYGRSPVGIGAVRHMVGDGARALLEKGFAATGGMPQISVVDEAMERFLNHYEAHIADFSRPFPGLIPVLDQLAARGIGMAVCTNKLERFSRNLLTQLGLSHYFCDVVGGDTLGVRKPDPGHILGTIRRANGRMESSVMIGDSMNDVAAAKSAGIPVIAVSFGYTAIPVHLLGAHYLINDFSELAGILDKM